MTRRCEEHGHALFDVRCSESGETYTVRVPWEHQSHWLGWGDTPRIRWSGLDGQQRYGRELSRGPAGIIAEDLDNERHLLPHGGWETWPWQEDQEDLDKARVRSHIRMGPSGPVLVKEHERQGGDPSPPPGFLEGSAIRVPMYVGLPDVLPMGHSLVPDRPGASEFGIYMTPRPRYARMYGDNVHEALVNIKAPLVVENKGEISPRDLTAEDIEQLKAQGYDGIVVTSSTTEAASEVVAFDRSQVWVLETRGLHKAKQHPPPPEGSRWITVHPHGPGSKGQAVLIVPAGDGTHRIVGGAGGKLNHLRLKHVKTPEQHAADRRAKRREKREREREALAKMTPDEREAHRQAKRDEREHKKSLKAEKRIRQRRIVEKVRESLGGVDADLEPDELAKLEPDVRRKLEQRHHQRQYRQAMKRRREVVEKLTDRRVQQLEDQAAVEAVLKEGDEWSEVQSVIERESDIIEQERARRRAARKPPPRVRDPEHDMEVATEQANTWLTALEPDDTRDQRDEKPKEHASDEMRRRAAILIDEARVLSDASRGELAEGDATEERREFQLVQDVVREEEGLEGETDRKRVLAAEAANRLWQAQAALADAEKLAQMERDGEAEKANRYVAARDLARGLSEKVSDAAERLGLRERDATPLREPEAAELMEVLSEVDRLRDVTQELDDLTKTAQDEHFDRSRRAFDLLESAPPTDDVAQTIEERALSELAQRISGLAAPGRSSHVQAVADGHYAQMADVALAVADTTYVDRITMDALGAKNAAILQRWAMEEDGHKPEAMLAALESHHVKTQAKLTTEALQQAEAFLPQLEETVQDVGDIEQALLQMDATESDIDAAERAIGAALGQMEATATMGQAYREDVPEHMTVGLNGQSAKDAAKWMQAVGLEPGDYEIDAKRKEIRIPRESWSKLVQREDPDTRAWRKEVRDLKRGDHDEEGWLPQGMVSRPVDSFRESNTEAPRYWKPIDLSGNLEQELGDHIGARLASGERAIDIERDLLSEELAQQHSDPDAYREQVSEFFPKHTEETRAATERNRELRARRAELQERVAAGDEEARAELARLPADEDVKPPTDFDHAEHYQGLAEQYLQRHHPDADPLHNRSLYGPNASQEQVGEAVFRMLSQRPAARAAFKPLGELDNDDRRALKAHLYERMGLKDGTFREHFEEEQAELLESVQGAKQEGGLFGGGAIETVEVTAENLAEHHPEEAKRLAMRYPREGRELFEQAMGERPDAYEGESLVADEHHAAVREVIENSPGAPAHQVAKKAARRVGRESAASEAGMTWQEYQVLASRARLLNGSEAEVAARAARAGLTVEQVQKAAGLHARLEVRAAELEPSIRPDHVETQFAAERWDSESAAFERQRRKAATPWAQFVEAHGDRARAYEALQDEMRHEALGDFQRHYNAVTGETLPTGVAQARHHELHRDAIKSPKERAALAEELRQERESMREGKRAGAGAVDASGKRIGGQFGAGRVLEERRKAAELEESEGQRQVGMFGAAPPPGGPSLFGAATTGKLNEIARPPRAADPKRGERVSLGDRAESEIEALVNGPMGGQFDPKAPGEKMGEDYKAGRLFPGASMDGKRATQQRVIKMLDSGPGRVGAWLGTGSGKTPTSIGAFTHLQAQGKVSHGFFLVPSAVEAQFGEEMQAFTEPGRFKWQTGSDSGSAAERLRMMQDDSVHMKVMTHQSFARDLLQVTADHLGVPPQQALERLRGMDVHQRAEVVRSALDGAGIPKGFTYVDEAHMLTTRQGQQETVQSVMIGAMTHPDNSSHMLLGTATPHKNDTSEVFAMARLLDPHRYDDPAKFQAAYGDGSVAAPDAIRRELDHLTYTDRIDPPVERRNTANPKIVDGRKVSSGPIELHPDHRAKVDAVNEAFHRVREARAAGTVDVESMKVLAPKRFEGVPESQHEAIARDLQKHAGIVRETAMRRAINLEPYATNAKLQGMVETIKHDREQGKQSLVFTDSLEEAKLVAQALEEQGISVGTYHGGLNSKERTTFRNRYRDGELSVGVLTAAGEAGINLQTAKTIHHYDVPMTMKSHAQRTGRAYRQGQTDDVDVHDWSTDTEFEGNAGKRLEAKGRLASVFETPLGPLDEHGFAAEYNAALAQKHQSFDSDHPRPVSSTHGGQRPQEAGGPPGEAASTPRAARARSEGSAQARPGAARQQPTRQRRGG